MFNISLTVSKIHPGKTYSDIRRTNPSIPATTYRSTQLHMMYMIPLVRAHRMYILSHGGGFLFI